MLPCGGVGAPRETTMNTRPLLLSVLLLGACDVIGKTCTLIAADDTLTVQFEAHTLDPGTYDLTMGTIGCSLQLSGEQAFCEDLDGSVHFDVQSTASGDAIERVSLFGEAPELVQLEVTRDGEQVLLQALSPTYEVREPNGPGCGDQFVAEVTVAFPE